MTQAVLSPFLVRVVDWSFTLLALAGIIICIHTAIDAQMDLRVLRRSRTNGSLRSTGRIARRGALAAGFLHVGFFAVGLSASLSALPPRPVYARTVLVGGAFVVMQGAIVLAQIINQFERAALRATPIEVL